MPSAMPYIEEPDDEFDPATDALDVIDNTAPESISATAGQLDATKVIRVPYNKVRSALRYYCSYSYADSASPWRLHRENPPQHPLFPQLRAYACDVVPEAPLASDNGLGTFRTIKLSPFADDLWYGDYSTMRLTVRYRNTGRVLYIEDDDMVENDWGEYWRSCEYWTEPAVESINVEGFNLVHAEGPPAGKPFPAPMPELMPRATVKIKWLNVAHSFVSADPWFLKPTKILGLLGKVNSTGFIVYDDSGGTPVVTWPTSTMMLLSVLFEERQGVVAPANILYPLSHYDITFELSYAPRTSDLLGSTKAGHVVFPQGTTGKWYWATRQNGDPFLKEGDLNQLFEHVNKP